MIDPRTQQWLGDAPYVLVIIGEDSVDVIDLDERGWLTSKKELLERPGQWHLLSKADMGIPFSLNIAAGERGLYAARHIGIVFTTADRQMEVTAYGLGKITPDGRELRMWVLPTGQICLDDDVLVFGRALIRTMMGQEAHMTTGKQTTGKRDETNTDGVQPQPAPGTASVPEENIPAEDQAERQRIAEEARAREADRRSAAHDQEPSNA